MPKIASNVLAVKSRLKGEPAVYQIAGVPGLHLAVLGGGRGSWRIRYRPRRGAAQQWHTIGDVQIVELGEAIDKARELLAGLQLDGVDPKAAADREAAAHLTFKQVYTEWLDHPGREKKLRPRTRDGYEQIYALHIGPRIGSERFVALAKTTIETALEKIRKATIDDDLGHRGLQATKALAIIRAVCRYGALEGYSDRDPTLGIKRPVPVAHPDGKQNRPPTNDELRALWHGCEARHEKSKRAFMAPPTQRAFKLSILLGKRISELLGARKTEVETGENANLFIPGTREGNKSREDQRVPLPPLALKLIEEAIAEGGKSPFVFPGARDPRKVMSRHTPSHALRKLREELKIAENVRLHDMRGLIVDQMAAMHVPSEYRSHVLHHVGDTKASLADSTYSSYDYLPEKRQALELWEKRLVEIVSDRKPSGLRW